mmetsp:Transcript_46247/g.122674  ORF Transcript_46247/g.122674 Transcript_46247/m.122674 type:complete len:216 (+) Transcript_46247:526-1173(+)
MVSALASDSLWRWARMFSSAAFDSAISVVNCSVCSLNCAISAVNASFFTVCSEILAFDSLFNVFAESVSDLHQESWVCSCDASFCNLVINSSMRVLTFTNPAPFTEGSAGSSDTNIERSLFCTLSAAARSKFKTFSRAGSACLKTCRFCKKKGAASAASAAASRASMPSMWLASICTRCLVNNNTGLEPAAAFPTSTPWITTRAFTRAAVSSTRI